MWQSYGKGKTRAQLQAEHDKTSNKAETRLCPVCGKRKLLDNFLPNCPECKWCNSAYRVGLNDKTRPQADRNGMVWTYDEDTYIGEATLEGKTDSEMALHLKRTMKSVRFHRGSVLGINKQAAPEQIAPKPLFNEYGQYRDDTITCVTVYTIGTKIMVYCNTHPQWNSILCAFRDAGLTDDDYKAWKIGVTA